MIGFVILVNPLNPLAQSERLVSKLNRMFDYPPIVCHHDFGQNPRFFEPLPYNVRLVRPHVATRWGDFSCVEAAVDALRLLYSSDDSPDWFVYLSGADYPIKPAAAILDELRSSPYDAHIEHVLIEHGSYDHAPNPFRTEGFKGPDRRLRWHKQYCSLRLSLPCLTKRLRPTRKVLWIDHPLIARWFIPFSNTFKCYAGEAWFCANRKSAHRILDFCDRDATLISHYRKVLVPEEAYFHTVLANSSSLKLSQDHLRYIDWTLGGSHPKTLTIADLPRIQSSGAHFARKFRFGVDDGSVLDALDRIAQ